jgi:uncharacterized protein YlzI (FlbEa/FlbD family)
MKHLPLIVMAMLAFHRIDGHIVWVNPAQINTVQGAGQLGYPSGTVLSAGSDHVTVTENVNEVIRAIRAQKAKD